MPRTMTVSRYFHRDTWVPMIRLRGDWLRRAGFPEGQRLQVEVANNTLVLRSLDEPLRADPTTS